MIESHYTLTVRFRRTDSAGWTVAARGASEVEAADLAAALRTRTHIAAVEVLSAR